MALTKAQFRNAIAHLTSSGNLPVSGERFVDATNLRVYDETYIDRIRTAQIDITPDENTLNQALIDLAASQQVQADIDIVQSNAKTQAANIPNWATWTETETLAYIDTNVTDLASAKVVIRAMARMIIALRNQEWPELEGN